MSSAASEHVSVDLPTPPFVLTSAITLHFAFPIISSTHHEVMASWLVVVMKTIGSGDRNKPVVSGDGF
jgi:nucleoside recognition membrane protein YjiH